MPTTAETKKPGRFHDPGGCSCKANTSKNCGYWLQRLDEVKAAAVSVGVQTSKPKSHEAPVLIFIQT